MGPAFIALGLTLPGLASAGWLALGVLRRRPWVEGLPERPCLGLRVVPGARGAGRATGHTSVFWLTLSWGGSATIAAVVGVFQTRIRPRPRMARSWWREHRDLGPRYLTEAAANTGASQAAWYGVGIVAGLSAVGAVRAALLMFGPLQILSTGIGLVAIPEGVRLMNRSLSDLELGAVAMSAGLAIVAIGWGGVLLLIPESFGVWLMGSTWDVVVPLLLPLAVTFAGLLAMTGPMMTLRAVANSRRSLRAGMSLLRLRRSSSSLPVPP